MHAGSRRLHSVVTIKPDEESMIAAKKKLSELVKNSKQILRSSKLQQVFRRQSLINAVKEWRPLAAVRAAPPTLETPDLFELGGYNWLEGESREPIAILWGVPQSKRNFVSRLLHNYRTAYAQ